MRPIGLAVVFTVLACGPARAPLTLHWTFEGGKTCAQVGVATIQVDVDGEVLSPNRFACVSGGVVTAGAKLGLYLPGTYRMTVSGLDPSNAVAYQKQTDVTVEQRGTDVSLDLGASVLSGSATLHWTFAGKTCAQAGVSIVHANVDGQPLTDAAGNPDIPCTQGGIDGATIEPLTAGAHAFELAGLVGGSVAYSAGNLNVTVQNGKDTLSAVDLQAAAPTTATAFLTFDFNGRDCAAAGVDHVYVLFDPAQDGSGGAASGDFACIGVDGKPVTSTFVDGVPAGTHSFAIRGSRQGTLTHYTHRPPSTLFQIGLQSNLYVPSEPVP